MSVYTFEFCGPDCFGDTFSKEAIAQMAERLPGQTVFLNFNYDRPIGRIESATLKDGRISVEVELQQCIHDDIAALQRIPDAGVHIAPTYIIEEKVLNGDITEITKALLVETSITVNPSNRKVSPKANSQEIPQD